MKASFVLFFPALVLVTLVAMATGRTLIRLKRQNYDALLQNKAFVESQLNCVLSRGHCDRIGHRIKILVPEVVQTRECKSCTDDERPNVQKVADHVKIHYPKEWNEIKDQFTPEEEDEEMEEQGGSSEDVAAEEEEAQELQREAKELDDGSQEDNQDINNNGSHEDNQDNNNNSSHEDNKNIKNNSSSHEDKYISSNSTQETEKTKQASPESGKQNGELQQKIERKKEGVETSTPK